MVMFLLSFLFWAYLRVLNKPLATQVATLFAKCEQTSVLPNTQLPTEAIADVSTQLDVIHMQLDLINQKLEAQSALESQREDVVITTTSPTKVDLYYFNQDVDDKLSPERQPSVNSILPVEHTIPVSDNLILDTVKELIQRKLTVAETKKWFVTDFPHPKFDVVWLRLTHDGILTLEFTEVPWLTSGWSARMLILSSTIEKTLFQFPEVKKIIFLPENMFQP